MWQATTCDCGLSQMPSAGSVVSHVLSANRQRVWKRHPGGGSMGFGGSPLIGDSTIRRAGSIDGRDANSARV